MPIQSFKDLVAWQKSHQLVLETYKITRSFPKEEVYALVDQMRRCAISITSNIAEGFSRKSYKEKVQFYSMSLGSVTELENQLIVSRDVGYITNETYSQIDSLILEVHKIINGLIKSSKDYARKP